MTVVHPTNGDISLITGLPLIDGQIGLKVMSNENKLLTWREIDDEYRALLDIIKNDADTTYRFISCEHSLMQRAWFQKNSDLLRSLPNISVPLLWQNRRNQKRRKILVDNVQQLETSKISIDYSADTFITDARYAKQLQSIGLRTMILEQPFDELEIEKQHVVIARTDTIFTQNPDKFLPWCAIYHVGVAA